MSMGTKNIQRFYDHKTWLYCGLLQKHTRTVLYRKV